MFYSIFFTTFAEDFIKNFNLKKYKNVYRKNWQQRRPYLECLVKR